jgi:hypothetical protein
MLMFRKIAALKGRPPISGEPDNSIASAGADDYEHALVGGVVARRASEAEHRSPIGEVQPDGQSVL